MKHTLTFSFYFKNIGKFLTSQVLRDRLFREIESNPALQVRESENKEALEVKGRGEMQMGVLIETMRREGFELSVSSPKVIFKAEGTGKAREILEPIEEVTIDVDHEYSGSVIENMSKRKGEMSDFLESGGKARLIFKIPTRGLLGYPAQFKHDVRIKRYFSIMKGKKKITLKSFVIYLSFHMLDFSFPTIPDLLI